MEISLLVALGGVISGIASLISHWYSARKLAQRRRKYDELVKLYKAKRENIYREKDDPEFYSKWVQFIASEAVEKATIESNSYRTLLNLSKNINQIGRASSLKNKSSAYMHLWVFLNSGLVNTILDRTLSSETVSEMDKSTVIGMLLGERIERDTKSYIYLLIALLASLLFPLVSSISINFWVVGIVLLMFSLLTLNHKVIEYRVTNGYYGSNEYEAREIIAYIETHSEPDDFNSDGRKRVFQNELPKEKECFVGLIEGLKA